MDQLRVSVDDIAQGDPTSPITSSSQVEEDLPASEKLLKSVFGSFYQDTLRADRLHIRRTYEDLDLVSDRLFDSGLKIRFDRGSKSSTVVTRSVMGLHETPTGSFLYLCQTDEDGNEVLLQGPLRIVVETSASESHQHMIEKSFKWLYETDYSVHVVITCNFTNIPSPGSNKPFEAEIAVWVRSGSRYLTLDYPCDECYGGHKHTAPGARSPSLVAHEGSGTFGRENGSRSQTPYIPPFDPLAHEHSHLDPGDPHREQRICCRSGNWIVAYDESTLAGQEEPELLLDVSLATPRKEATYRIELLGREGEE
ncbi:unnamed protein product [Rhizoctonia solani]|uniref:Uncharacterized protein n=1 Tax=Rhizoctonia solani TaxID=456999 RepID=A0A8H2XNS3_9AGAM|nr:unnamed protein product [Rhizoctonia solani]